MTSINERFDVEESYPYILNGCEISFSGNVAVGIKKISFKCYSEDSGSED